MKKTETPTEPIPNMPEFASEELIAEKEVDITKLPKITQTAIEKFNEMKESDAPDFDALDKLDTEIWNAVTDFIDGEEDDGIEDDDEEEGAENDKKTDAPEAKNNDKKTDDAENNTPADKQNATMNTDNTPPATPAADGGAAAATATPAATAVAATEQTAAPATATPDKIDTSKFPTAVKEEPKKTDAPAAPRKSLLRRIMSGN